MSIRSDIKFNIDPEGCFSLAPFLRTHPDYSYQDVREAIRDLVDEGELIPWGKSGLRFYSG
jgi:hypothetical protein